MGFDVTLTYIQSAVGLDSRPRFREDMLSQE